MPPKRGRRSGGRGRGKQLTGAQEIAEQADKSQTESAIEAEEIHEGQGSGETPLQENTEETLLQENEEETPAERMCEGEKEDGENMAGEGIEEKESAEGDTEMVPTDRIEEETLAGAIKQETTSGDGNEEEMILEENEKDTKATTEKAASRMQTDSKIKEKDAKDSGMETDKSATPSKKKAAAKKFEAPTVIVTAIPPFAVDNMRSHWKWSIRIHAVTPEDAVMSGLMSLPKVQDAYFYLPQGDQNKGQMELCIASTNDTILTMLRILRNPFVNRMITIELTRRSRAKPQVTSGKEVTADDLKTEAADDLEAAQDEGVSQSSEQNGVEGEQMAAQEEEKKDEDTEEESEEVAESGPQGGNSGSLAWDEVRETATFVVNLTRVQRVKYSRKMKGEMSRRCVYLGTLPKSTTEEMLKVIFPLANGITMKPTDDPNMRHVFIETCHHYNAVGFLLSYPGVVVNSQELKLSIKEEDLMMVKSEKPTAKTGEGSKTAEEGKATKEKLEGDDKEDAEANVSASDEQKEENQTREEETGKMEEEGEEGAEGEGDGIGQDVTEVKAAEDGDETKKDDNVEENEGGKPEAKKRKLEKKEGTEEQIDQTEKKNRLKRKRRHSLMEEIQREWNQKPPKENPGNMPPPKSPITPRSGVFARGRGRGAFGRGAKSGFLGQAPPPQPPPMFHMQDKIAGLMRLQNQLQQTIHSQMNFIQHSEMVARQQAEMRMRSMEGHGRGMGLGGGMRGGDGPRRGAGQNFSGIVGRHFGGGTKGGNKSRNFQRSPSHDEGTKEQQGAGFSKKFRRDSNSGEPSGNKSPKGSAGSSQKDSFQGNFGGKNSQAGAQGEAGRKKTGRGGKSFGGGNTNKQFGSAGSSFGGGSPSKFGGNKFGGAGKMGNKFGGGNSAKGGSRFGGGNLSKMGRSSGDGGNSFGGGGNNFGAGGNSFRRESNQMRSGSNFGGSGSSFGGGGNQTGSRASRFGSSGSQFGGTSNISTLGSSSWGLETGGSSFGRGSSFNDDDFVSGGSSYGGYGSGSSYGTTGMSGAGGGFLSSASSFGSSSGFGGSSGFSSDNFAGSSQQSWSQGNNQMGSTYGNMQSGYASNYNRY